MKVASRYFKVLGINMAVVSPLVICLAIADIVVTYNTYSCSSGCQLNTGLALTWVGIGLWAPIPIFINGVFVAKIAGKEFKRGSICLLSFMSTFLFAPALVVISALEAYFKFQQGLPSTSDNQKLALFAIEIAIGGIGLVLLLHALAVFKTICCKESWIKRKAAKAAKAQKHEQPQVPQELPDSAVNHMNIWSAYRLMENKCPACTAPPQQLPPGSPWRSSYYALNAPTSQYYVAATSSQAPGASSCQCNNQSPKPVLSSPTAGVTSYPYNHQPPRQVLAGGPVYSSRW